MNYATPRNDRQARAGHARESRPTGSLLQHALEAVHFSCRPDCMNRSSPTLTMRDALVLTVLQLLLPVGRAATWDCTNHPLAQAVVGNGGSNSYSTVLSWDFNSKTFTTTVSTVTKSDGSNLKVNGCSYDSSSQYVFCFKTGSVDLYRLDDGGVGTLMTLSWTAGYTVDCTISTDGQVVAAGAYSGVKYFILAGSCSKSLWSIDLTGGGTSFSASQLVTNANMGSFNGVDVAVSNSYVATVKNDGRFCTFSRPPAGG